jgi:hypothetical protein
MRSCNKCCSGKVISITYSECVFVALHIQHTTIMHHVVICGLSGCTNVSTLSHKRHDFRNESLLSVKCVFWIALQFLSEMFLILKIIEWDVIKMFIGLHVNYPLFVSELDETGILSTYFREILKYQISWKSVEWEPSSLLTDEQTWRNH